ncbi:MAG: ATP-binding protein [Lachnospiraceae bacterium]|nr:ATP-binding protein [Lachnospiraceae bacterium]
MGLSNKQFDSILEKYDNIRLENHYIQLKRQEDVSKKAPAYSECEDSIRSFRMKKMQAQLNGDTETFALLTDQENLLKDKRDQILKEAGFAADYLLPIYVCTKCKDTGFLPESRQKCSCFMEAQTRLLFEQSGIYDLIQKQNFDTLSFEFFDEKESQHYAQALNISRNFIKNFDIDYQNLIFYGNVGTGKTFLSCCIAKALMEKGCSVTYCSADKLFKNLVDLRFVDDKSSYFSFMEDVNQCDLLIIDDLGAEAITDRARADLFTCLNNRDLLRKATLISTNLTLDELNRRYSERIFSRLSSRYTFCKFEGRDIRMLKKMQENRK